MKILVDLTATYDHLTGIERFAINITKALIEQHAEHDYVLLFKNEVHPAFGAIAQAPSVECIVLSGANKLVFNQWTLPRALRRFSADTFFFPAFCAPWLFHTPGIVNTIHDLSDFECHEGKPWLKALYSRLGIRHAKRCSAHIVTVSSFSKERIVTLLGIPEEKVSIVYNGVSDRFNKEAFNDTDICSKYDIPGDYLLTVGTVEPRKNLRLLIEAYQAMQASIGIDLVICGRMGWNQKDSLGSAGLWAGIHVTGFVDDDDLPSLYHHARAFVFPSKYEGFGIPPVEALAAGCPVVCSDAASLPEIVGDAAVYFKSESVESLKEAINAILNMDDKMRGDLRRRGVVQASKYRWETEAEKLHDVLMRTGAAAKDREDQSLKRAHEGK